MMIKNLISNTRLMPLAMALIAASALSIALISQYVFNMHPCILCIFQRYPYGIVIALGLIGFAFSRQSTKTVSGIMALIGVTFLCNAVIAAYHSGVERQWWKSFLESCSVPELRGDMEQILADIQSRAHAARCDEIPWADPVFGLSMANYNVAFCLGLGVIALMSAWRMMKHT